MVQALTHKAHLHTGEEFGHPDKKSDTVYFIVKGMVRIYRIIDGEDFTYYFCPSGELCADYQSIIMKTPGKQYFQATTPTDLIAISYSKIEALFEAHPRIERIARKLSETAYIRLAERVKEFQSDSLEQRYLNLIEHHEELFQTASLQHIASYLGVKPQSLSRIRAKILKK